ncbi:UV-endonuclease UvdE-domain-containing protein [Crepidotus variabilis]|uniref:UV-endonuclease UvdE-domain-containing protein n=1 Tax=Crepidotus variabilis TaxID=179855 RepID=A0A9P6JQ59_9AGAR|nr:UV-endonuclease UvdE-domain-containing protein [Crepidotus variabilis]
MSTQPSSGVVLRRSTRALTVATHSTEVQPPIVPPPPPTPKVVSVKRKRTVVEATEIVEATSQVSDAEQSPKKKRTKKAKAVVDTEEFQESPSKPKRKRQPKPEPMYVIPDVEKKKTTFKGRLGYACLNTVLRNKKPASETVFCSRTCRLDSIKKNGLDFVKDLARKNVEDLLTVIQWNEDNNIRFFRVSSEIFPYASHDKHGYSLNYCSELLAKAGALARKYGHRLTTHPGQFTQLGSPKPAVVEASRRELAYHTEMFELMGMGSDSVMIIHGGGVYDDKEGTLKRLKGSIKNLSPNVRARLVLENDEMCYNAEDLLPICEELDVPLVFDYHHDQLFPSSIPPKTIIERANAIWKRRGIKPKQHLSEPRPGAVSLMERRAHADRCENLPPDLPDDMGKEIGAKDKEQAVLYLHRMYDLQPVVHASLRPANPNPSMRTNGRKASPKKPSAKAIKKQAEKRGLDDSDASDLTDCPSEDEELPVEEEEDAGEEA